MARATTQRAGRTARRFSRAWRAGALATLAPSLRAQADYPTKPIKLIAPVQPGGGVDLVARTIGDRLGRALGQSIVVENMSGGGGVVGSLATARAAPDGYTLMVGYVGTHGTNPAVRKLPYDAIRDFTPIAMVGGTPNVLVVAPSLPVATLRELIAYAKANPGKLSYGSSGPGTLTHLAMEQLKVAADLDVVHIPYRGIGPAFVDLLGGQTQIMFPGLAAALPHIKAGKVKPLAVTGTKRHPLLPDVPTFAESGLSGIRRRPVVRHRRAGEPAAGDRQAPERGNRQAAAEPGARGAAVRRSARADADVAGRLRPLHPRRHRALDEARERAAHRDQRLTETRGRSWHATRRYRSRRPGAGDHEDPRGIRRRSPVEGMDRCRRARDAADAPELYRLRDRRLAASDVRSRATPR